jgi:hypothetical protein
VGRHARIARVVFENAQMHVGSLNYRVTDNGLPFALIR